MWVGRKTTQRCKCLHVTIRQQKAQTSIESVHVCLLPCKRSREPLFHVFPSDAHQRQPFRQDHQLTTKKSQVSSEDHSLNSAEQVPIESQLQRQSVAATNATAIRSHHYHNRVPPAEGTPPTTQQYSIIPDETEEERKLTSAYRRFDSPALPSTPQGQRTVFRLLW